MAIKQKEITICDICGNETDDFYYYRSTCDPFGEVSSSTLVIDVCEKCARSIKYDIPEEMMAERYENDISKEENITKKIEEWRNMIIEY